MAGMFCLSKEPPGKAFITQAEWWGEDTLSPQIGTPAPSRLQRLNELEAAAPTSASLQKPSAFLGAETSPMTPGKSQGWRSLVGCRLRGRTESDTTEVT